MPGERHLIDSPQNPRFKDLRRLLAAKGIARQGRALVSGSRLVADVRARHLELVDGWVCAGHHLLPAEPLDLIQLSSDLFRELDVLGTDHPLLVVRVPEPEVWQPGEGFGPGATLLVPFQDPENVGAVLRSAAAFGVTEAILLREAAHPWLPRAIRASAGAVFSLTLRQGPSIRDLDPSLAVVALSGEGTPLETFPFPERFALLPGLEGPGLPEVWRSGAVSIPTTGAVESLNAATATAVVLHQWFARQQAPASRE